MIQMLKFNMLQFWLFIEGHVRWIVGNAHSNFHNILILPVRVERVETMMLVLDKSFICLEDFQNLDRAERSGVKKHPIFFLREIESLNIQMWWVGWVEE